MTPSTPTGWSRRRTLATGITTAGLLVAGTACGTTHSAESALRPPIDPRDRSRRWARRTLARMSLEEKVGQLFVTYAYGQTADTTDPADVSRNQDWIGVDNATALLKKYHLGGIIYFAWSDNLADPPAIAALSNQLQKVACEHGAKVPLLISTDQEHGVVVRVGPPATQFPGNMALGASGNADDARTAGAIAGFELRAMGINQDFAPDADVNVNPANPVIGVRSYSGDPQLAATLTAAQVTGYQQTGGVAAAAKHFPGHGDTATDSHTDLPVIEHSRQEWETLDRPPFEAAIAAEIDVIMTAHIQFPALDDTGDPATLSQPIQTGLLREELGFDGVVITDSLSMEGVRKLYDDEVIPVRALTAGVDMLLMPFDLDLAYRSVLAAVDSGELPLERLNEAVTRILTVKHFRGIVDDPYCDPDRLDELVGTEENLAEAALITEATTTLVKNDDSVLPLGAGVSTVFVTGAQDPQLVADSITAHGPATTVLTTGLDPDTATITEAVDRAATADVVVVLTREVPRHPAQTALVEALRAGASPVVVVSIKEPYDLTEFPEAETYLATYSYTAGALTAVGKVLCGAVQPSGRLPVMIPRPDDPDTPLFDIGHGLDYSTT